MIYQFFLAVGILILLGRSWIATWLGLPEPLVIAVGACLTILQAVRQDKLRSEKDKIVTHSNMEKIERRDIFYAFAGFGFGVLGIAYLIISAQLEWPDVREVSIFIFAAVVGTLIISAVAAHLVAAHLIVDRWTNWPRPEQYFARRKEIRLKVFEASASALLYVFILTTILMLSSDDTDSFFSADTFLAVPMVGSAVISTLYVWFRWFDVPETQETS